MLYFAVILSSLASNLSVPTHIAFIPTSALSDNFMSKPFFVPFTIMMWKVWLSLIAGLDCGLDRWTGLLDWILKEDVRLACKTACVVKTYASQGHMDVVEARK